MTRIKIGSFSFEYPDGWNALADEETPEQPTVTIAGQGTAFCTVSIVDAAVTPDAALEAVVDAYRQEYEAVDVYPVSPHGLELEFFSLELCNTAWLRSFRNDSGTVVLVFQCTDAEVDSERRSFERIYGSLLQSGSVAE